MKKFISTLDQMSVLITCFMVAITISIFISGYLSYKKSGGEPIVFVFAIATSVLMVVLIAALYMLQTSAISVSETGLTIERRVKPLQIKFSDIATVRVIPKSEMGIVVRTFGNGGLFGYTGMYYSKKQGAMTWYCTNRKAYVLIAKADGKKLVISPDDAEGLVQAISQADPHLKTAR